ncbi:MULTISPECIES: DUF6460 domain-containing protein [unclassified Beijerinckia]|uniref:DUF6460 domain-containing protein n=1 Tax=unclassified Beijerinckia TaxID=2638183 RepID=UPI00089A62B9|nr:MULTISPECIES: DUF6460 domain-containing protein [unclassified Beijerinckia]MDH7797345.1 hypothetical protein [Beijerinckia sp. GAS462]SEC81880.1 hypothetical protein SAMN05443249_3639 [Beijerinckia sp. 28-YEA-48]
MTDHLDPPKSQSQGSSGWGGASWTGARQEAADAAPASNNVEQFLGGSPAAVVVRLLVVSLIVGALLMWLDIRPMDIFYGLQRFLTRLWNLGFDAVREVIQYVLAGAAIVIPVWIVLRLLNAGKKR